MREENDCLQRFAEHHAEQLPAGMMRLIVNLDYAVRNGALLQDPRQAREDYPMPMRRSGGRVYRSG